MTVKTVSASF